MVYVYLQNRFFVDIIKSKTLADIGIYGDLAYWIWWGSWSGPRVGSVFLLLFTFLGLTMFVVARFFQINNIILKFQMIFSFGEAKSIFEKFNCFFNRRFPRFARLCHYVFRNPGGLLIFASLCIYLFLLAWIKWRFQCLEKGFPLFHYSPEICFLTRNAIITAW